MISILTLKNKEEWDCIVKSFINYDVYYLSDYVKAFQINGDGEPQLFYFESEKTRAINVVIRRDLADFNHFKKYIVKDQYFDLVTPYGYGGFLVEGNDITKLEEEYKEFCLKEHIICEFVRFHPILKNVEKLNNFYTCIHLGDTIYIDTYDKEIIWKNFSSKNRNVIRKAQKAGLKIYWGRDPELIKPFMKIYNATMDRDKAAEYYYFDMKFYESILEDLKQNAMWFYAKKDEKIVSIAIFLFCNKKMHYHLSAACKEYQNLAPTNLLLYEAAIWAFNHGYLTLHMGGGVEAKHDSLYKFKKAFNRKDEVEFYIGKKIFDEENYRKFVQLRKKIDKNYDEDRNYFPSYRA